MCFTPMNKQQHNKKQKKRKKKEKKKKHSLKDLGHKLTSMRNESLSVL